MNLSPRRPRTRAAGLLLIALALAGCGAGELTLGADGPPPSTFQTPLPSVAPAQRAEPTAQILGTAEVRP